jgi:DNA-binding CsgD family transcriptional regulator/tetratricopeptide (TPR) repeat protein
VDEVVRTHPLRPWLAEISRADAVERIDLDPLSELDLVELVRNIDGREPTRQVVTQLHRRTEGNPFFVEEILACPDYEQDALPTSLRDVLLARVDGLAAPSRGLLDIAAVGGQEVEHELLVRVTGLGDAAAAPHLRELVDGALLVPTSIDERDGYAFRHALLREAVLDTLLPTESRRLHSAYAEVLAADEGGSGLSASHLVELAYHWREARDPRALVASIEAGDAAKASLAFDAASREYDHALRLWDPRLVGGLGLDHVGLLERAAVAAYLASDYRRSVDLRREALAELTPDSDPSLRSRLLGQLGRSLWVWGEYRQSVEAYEGSLAVVPDDAADARARALSGLGQIYMLFAWYRRAIPLLEEAHELARRVGDRALEGHALNSLGTSLGGIGRVDEGMTAIDEALAIALELGLPDDIGRAYVNRSDILLMGGRPVEALASAREGIEVVAQRGMMLSYGGYLRHGGVDFAFQSGRWDEARRLLAEADRFGLEGEGARLYRASYALPFLVASGDPDAEVIWPLAVNRYRTSPPDGTAAQAYAAGIELLAMQGRSDEALPVLEEGLGIVGQTDGGLLASGLARAGAWASADVAIARRAAGDLEAAAACLATIDDLSASVSEFRRWVGRPGTRLDMVLELSEVQIRNERDRATGDGSAAAWHELAEGWDSVDQPYRSLHARWREAEALELAGEHAAATSVLRDTHAGAERLGARPLVGQLAVLARRMRVRLGTRDTTPEAEVPASPFGLTPREHEVLARVALGRTNRQIAGELFISESTAGVHVSNILSKLGVATRTEAARIALSQGLVEV